VHIAIMGSGGIGGYLGIRLAAAGEDVGFIARGAHLDVMRHQGLRLASPLGDVELKEVTATDTPSELGTADVVIFTVKLYDSESAAAAIVPLVGPLTRVVTLQNGIDGVGILARHVPRPQVIGGVAYISTYLERPGLIAHPGGSSRFLIGGRGDATMEALCEASARAGIDVATIDDIDQAIWTKFVTLSAFSGATSLTRSGIGAIMADPQAKLLIEQLREEAMAVAAAAGHPMPQGFVENVEALWRTFPPETQSSMSNDLARGKRIEVAWLSGRVHALGLELGVPTPGHTSVYRALHLHADGH